MRSALGCAVAFGAMAAGPALCGAAVANAGLLGDLGPDIDVIGIDVSGNSNDKKSQLGGGPGLPVVSTAPSTRNVVVRTRLPAAQAGPKVVPAVSSIPVAEAPAVALGTPMVDTVPAAPALPALPIPAAVPLSVPGLFPAAPPVHSPAREAFPIPPTVVPGPGRPFGPADSSPIPTKIPDSFRVGYAEYLRAATTSDLFFAALPGVAGIAGFTVLGAYAGYRQARAVQAALLAPAPTSILL
jgi:hypothetical protein